MNIFVLHTDPNKAAIMQCDKHVVKMPLEAVQMLCTIYHINNIKAPYRKTHEKHPCVLWLQESYDNFEWLLTHTLALFEEYTFRYNKIHKSQKVLEWCINNKVKIKCKIDSVGITKFALAMPDEYKNRGAVVSYRNYYINEKLKIAKWKLNNKPNWVKNVITK